MTDMSLIKDTPEFAEFQACAFAHLRNRPDHMLIDVVWFLWGCRLCFLVFLMISAEGWRGKFLAPLGIEA